MKKLTASVLLVVLSSSVALINAQQGKNDTIAPKETQIGEVVITGALGIKKKQDAQTSSIAVVKNDQLTQAKSQNLAQSLTGKVSGLVINQSSSSVNGTFDIQIRDPKTITGSTSPLIVIDGVISSLAFFQRLPSEMVESTSILKGQQAAALYGSAGINGAIIVNTKKGTAKGRVSVTINSNIDFDNVQFLPSRQKSYGQGWEGQRIHVENGAWGPKFDGSQVGIGLPFYDVNGDGNLSYALDGTVAPQDEAAILKGTYSPLGKDNVKEFFKTGTLLSNGVTIASGGSEGYASLSLNRQDREFVVENDKNKVTSAILKAGFNKDRWSFDGSMSYINQQTSTTNPIIYQNLLQSSAEIPITSFSGMKDQGYAWNIYYQNPYWTIKHERLSAKNHLVNGTANLTYKINKNISLVNTGTLQLTVGDGMNYRDLYNGSLTNPTLLGTTAIGSYFNQSNNISRYLYNDFMVNMDYDITDDLKAKLILGYNVQDTYGKTTSGGGSGLKLPGIYQVWNLTTPTQPYNLNNQRSQLRKNAVFGNLDISYKNYLYLNITGRNEWSSKFIHSDLTAPVDYSYFYPSAGISFLPMNAFEGLKGGALSRLVVKGSWTRVGNDPIATYAIEDTAVLGSGFPFGTGPLSFVGNGSPTSLLIRPEISTTVEANLGLGFFRDRITLDANVYQTNTTDLISNQSTSSASGINNRLINVGEIRNRGIELDLGLSPIRSKDFSWDMKFSYFSYKTKVLELAQGQDEVAIYDGGNVGIYAIKGQEFPVIKGTAYQRDDQGRIIIDPTNGDPLYTNNLVTLGKVNPDYILSFSTNFRFKNFSAYAVMDYRTGNKFYSAVKEGMAFSGQLEESASFDRDNGGYVIPNSVYMNTAGQYVANTDIKTGGNDYASVVSYFGGKYRLVGENFMVDGTAFKVRELGINYTLGKELSESIGLNTVTIGVYARNPFYVFSKENRGYGDPETSIGSGSNLKGIAGVNQYPAIRTVGFSTTINF